VVIMGTNLQEVFDSFFIKLPSVNFTSKESQVFQFFKTAISKCYKKTYDKLDYVFNETNYTGYFNNIISKDSIELIAMFMVKEYFFQVFNLILGRKTYLGTQAFNKIPSNKEQYEVAKSQLELWNNELDNFIKDFPDYSNER